MTLDQRTRALDRSGIRIFEKRLAHLYDLANEIAGPSFRPFSLTEDSLRERFDALTSPAHAEGAADINRPDADAALAAERAHERVLVCRLLARRAAPTPEREEELIALLLSSFAPESEPEEEEEETDGNRVVYLRSSYADEAYMRFSNVIPELRADYAGSFSGVCETVYYNRARLCILPIENSTDGTLVSFRSLITRHGLKLIATCDVSTGEEQSTRFALLRKALSPLPGQRTDAPERFFRFLFFPTPTLSLAAVLDAAAALHLQLYKTEALPISYIGNGFAYDITMQAEGNLAAFLVYLTLCAPDYEPLGIYGHWGKRD